MLVSHASLVSPLRMTREEKILKPSAQYLVPNFRYPALGILIHILTFSRAWSLIPSLFSHTKGAYE